MRANRLLWLIDVAPPSTDSVAGFRFSQSRLTAFAVFIVVAVLFYSSFFTNYPKGVSDAFKTLNLWRQRTHEHEHPWYQYTYWLLWEEGALMVLGGFWGADCDVAG